MHTSSLEVMARTIVTLTMYNPALKRGFVTFQPSDGCQGAGDRLHEVRVQRYIVSQLCANMSEFSSQRCDPVWTQGAPHAEEVLLPRLR